MLNELFELTRSRQNARITNGDSRCDSYNSCPKGTTIRVLLDEIGGVTDFEVIRDISQKEDIMKYEPANGQSFPAFNIKPLYWAGTDELRQKIKAIKKQIEMGQSVGPSMAETVAACSVLWGETEKKKLAKCCRLAEKCGTIIDKPPTEMSSIAVLATRVAKCTPDALFAGIKDAAIRKVERCDQGIVEWLDKVLLCTIQDKDKAKTKSISIVCDLSDRSVYAYPPTHDKVQRWFNSRLMEIEARKDKSSSDLDAFGGVATGANVKKFPPATIWRFPGRVKLRSMNSESPCQNRYGQADAASFCVGKNMRQNMKKSLEWLGKEERKNFTWRDVSGVCGHTKRNGKKVPIPGVLFAYPSILSDTLPPVPAMFAGEEGASDPDGSGFAATAKRVVDGLNGILKEKPDAEIRVFVLTKADKARTKLLLSKHYAASRISVAAEEWQNGCKNIPKICINIGTKDKTLWSIPFVPFPTEVVSCLNVVWYRDGNRAEQISGVNISEGLSLLLEMPPYIERTANRLLNVVIRNTSTLLLALGHADRKGDGSFAWGKSTKAYAKHANLLPCILGLILDKLGYKKGDYMHTAPFLVGQMMSLADTLHKEYCKHVRADKGDTNNGSAPKGEKSSGLPRQLIGNAAMVVAMDNPVEGLSRLGERILIYQSWANTTSGDIGYAGWALNEFRRVSEELGKLTLPDQSTDPEKAQVLLGYLSRIGEQKDNNDNTTSTESEE